MKDKDSLWQQMLAKRAQWAEQQPSLSAEIKAMGREAIKDIRATLHQSYFGQPEHMPEQGTPLNPTPQIVTTDLRKGHGTYEAMLDSYAPRSQEHEHEKELER